ncbi:type I polyketide synthase [Streptomyces sp. NRRL F-5650]|uniref:type I polyketide synthase n=1 Tax=Streptomyces sp. NRRL F-5650 TaxID=1463868 RepID=UPI000569ED4C|nr:type I polyketide synthase [Streptomyces sp. NRRL F-5650]
MVSDEKLVDYLKRVTADLKRTRQRVHELESGGTEPVAVVAMGCRFPGGIAGPDDLWEFVRLGGDAVSEFPTDRGWPADRSAGTYRRAGGFLHDAGDFDAGLFGISPREALAMDPQQRLLLETAWETLERAGIDPTSVRGDDGGVFIGMADQRYGPRDEERLEEVRGLVLTGTTSSVASGRIAYSFGLRGPAITIDTACSSSLVALHLAMRSLRAGECSFALVGGAAVMAEPTLFAEMAEQGGMAGDGRCKSFAADADGTGWGEGVGMLLLLPLSAARERGLPVLATVRGTAVNQDGASNGLSAPNGPAQRRVIRKALDDAGLGVGQIDAVEAHGTGTALGDPIEAQALLATYGQDRAGDEPLWLGSVKSNIGHTQAAAGLAGVIKMVQALRHGVLPRTLHADEPTPQVDWSAGAVRLLTEERPWPDTGRPRRAAVSSFGISGTNAHVVLELPADATDPTGTAADPTGTDADAAADADADAAADATDATGTAGEPGRDRSPVPAGPAAVPVPWLVSAAGAEALRAQARRLHRFAEAPGAPGLLDTALSLSAARARLDHRAVVLGTDRDALLAELEALARGEKTPRTVRGRTAPSGALAFLFTGQGAQRTGMGRELYATFPAYAAAFDAVCAELDGRLPRPLKSVLFAEPGTPEAALIDQTLYGQTAVFALEVALFRLLDAWGVRPGVLLGHSVGELAAAHVAGVWTLPDACHVVAARAGLMQELPAGGAMLSVAAGEERIADVLGDPAGADVDVAAVNGPAATVLSGPEEAVEAAAGQLAEAGLRTKRLRVSHAFHSALMEPMLDRFEREISTVTFRQPELPVVSNLTGERAEPDQLTSPAYWVRQVRGTVRFARGVGRLADHGVTACLELGPDGVLSALVRDCLGDDARGTALVSALRRDHEEPAALLTALAELHVRGVDVDWTGMLAARGGRPTALPTYPFQRERYWLPATPVAPAAPSQPAQALLYPVGWVPAAGGDPGARPEGTWLVVAGDGADGLRVAEALGPRTLTVTHGPAGPDGSEAPDGLGERLREALADAGPLGGVLALPAGTGAAAVQDRLALHAALRDLGVRAPVWCATRAAVPVGGEDAPGAGQAPLWGLGRALDTGGGGTVDLPRNLDARCLRLLAAVLADPSGADELAVRAAGVFARRLHPVRPAGHAPHRWRDGGTVLVTGDVAAATAGLLRMLGGDGERPVVLARRPGTGEPAAAADAPCVSVEWDPEGPAPRTPSPVTAVVHLDNIRPSAPQDTAPAAVAAAVAERLRTLDRLSQLFGAQDLDAFVLLSSVAGIWGGTDDLAHAAVHAALESAAERRAAAGLRATCVGWGPWAGADDGPGVPGLTPMPPGQALAALGSVLDDGITVCAVADVDWPVFHPVLTGRRPRPVVSALPEVRALAERAPAAPPVRSGPDRDTADLAHTLRDLVLTEAAAVLGHASRDTIDPLRPFRDAGFESLTAVRFRDRIAAETGLSLSATLVFDHPTPEEVVAHLVAELTGRAPGEAEQAPAAARHDDPVVIVGMACRYPGGAETPEGLWDLVRSGRDGVGDFPADRGWDLPALRRAAPHLALRAGFLSDATAFDAAFFGVSPREALAMDPQQRLLLEASWQAVEAAGIDPASLRGSRTGVFAGVAGSDYGAALAGAPEAEGYLMTGTATSVVSGRIAYTLGLHGPALTVDTACSSSLVALHTAVGALEKGECDLALAGGVAVISTPAAFVDFAKQDGLAADGRCKAFGAGADGTNWAEGVGVLLVERLSDARRNGHRVLAVVRGSAVNSDGASNGLAAPNGGAQQRVIRQALADAGLSAADVDALEAHGTGTALGDPIEAQAVLATYGRERADGRPLWLGSLKSNIGHSAAAAGVGGIIKMVQAMRHGILPPTLHADEPTPEVDWSSGAVELLTETREWPDTGRPRRAAVSSFGVSGTNAHVILRGLTAEETGHALFTTRSAFEHRAVVLGDTTGDFRPGLDALAAGEPSASVVVGAPRPTGRGPVFVFPGQGSQWAGMASELLDTSQVFADRWAQCERALAPYLDVPLTEALHEGTALERADVVQPLLFAVMVSLAEVWRAYGVRPAAVVGHSQGEIAAACVAGALSLDDAARVVALRARALGALAGAGGMVSVALPREEAESWLPRWDGRLSVAAVNGPASVVVSGEPADLDALMEYARSRDVRVRRIEVDYASHSAQVARIEDEVLRLLEPVRPRASEVPFLSTVTARWQDTTGLDAAYWYRNLREPVLFAPAVDALVEQGHTVFVEVSPHPVLTSGLLETAERADADLTVTGTLRRGEGGLARMHASLAELWVRGTPVDWTPAFGPAPARPVPLPTYAFQRSRYWPEPRPAVSDPAYDTFWRAVDEADLPGLARTLGVGGDQPLREVLPALSAWRRSRTERAVVDGWRYRVTWKPLPDAAAAELPGTWLLVTPEAAADDPAATAVLDAVRQAAGATVTVAVGAADEPAPLAATLRAALADAGAADPDLAGVLTLTGTDVTPHPASPVVPLGTALTVTLLQALHTAGIEAPLWCLTRGAVAAGEDDDRPGSPLQAALWALGRIAAVESPDTWGGLVDLPGTLDEASAGRLLAVLAGGGDEDQIAVRASGTYGRRLVRARPAATPGAGWKPRGTVLVTGGTGALGGRVARWLAREGAEHLVLTSRRGPGAPGADDLAAELTALGARVTVTACDLGVPEQARELVDRVRDGGDRIGAVIHTAGAGGLGPIREATLADMELAMAGKVAGIDHLERALGDEQPDVVVYFSSISASWGAGDHGIYAAANAVLDARAQARHAAGVHTVSVAWAPWGGGGMIDDPAVADMLNRMGLPLVDPDLAIGGLATVLAEGEESLLLVDVDWGRFIPQFTLRRPSRLFDELPEARADEAGAGPVAGDDLSPLGRRLAGLSGAKRATALRDLVREHVAAVLGHADPSAVDAGRALKDLGFDSLTAVELRDRLSTVAGLRLPATLVFDHPTIAELADFLGRGLEPATEQPAAPATVVRVDQDEPVAVVSMACRYPGAVASAEDLWQAVLDERDLITPFPDDRGWPLHRILNGDPDTPGTSYVDHGGFLHDAGDFDPGFFGISPREAQAMDPQHRLLLTTSWEVLERAGIAPGSLRGSRTGVYVGVTDQSYGTRLRGSTDGMEGFLVSAASSVASGRISYSLGLQGPALTVDTACSSSLVALHTAAQALRGGECDLAIAGGATVMPDPTSFVAFSRQRGLAANGRCKPFAAAADGFSLGEGAGVLLLERLSDARRLGHPVLALIRGSAVNQDGASNGITAPNGPSQERVIRQALTNAALPPSAVDVVEAHGTGTSLGDPIEAQALLATYGQDRPDGRPLWLGSVKSNIGHTQAAAGLAGVIKMIQAMRHGLMPRTLHVDERSPHVDWSAGAVELLVEARPWPRGEEPRRAGVSAFGISGTNAHIVLEEADERPLDDTGTDATGTDATGTDGAVESGGVPDVRPVPLVLSARTPDALRDQGARLAALLDDRDEHRVTDLAFSLATTRGVLDRAAVLVAADRDELARSLADPAAHGAAEERAEGGLALLFTGQGAQRTGMGRGLYEAFPAYAAAFDEVCAELDRHLPRPLRTVLWAGPGTDEAALLDQTLYTQTGLFAVEVALFRLLEHWGVRPDALLGHSVGELAAAHVAGVWSAADAARVVAARARLMQELPEDGAMLSVAAAEETVSALLGDAFAKVAVAAVNGPAALVLSGTEKAVTAAGTRLAEAGVRTKRLTVSHAFHSPLMEPMLAAYERELARVSFAEPALPVVSDLTGEVAGAALCDPAYWVRQVRDTVRFAEGVGTLLDEGVTTFLELGPDGVLTAMAQETAGERAAGIAAQRRDRDQVRTLLTALGRLHVRTGRVDWAAFFAGSGARRVDLPTYAFQHRRYWLDAPAGGEGALEGAGLTGLGHPLLKASVTLPGTGESLFSGALPGPADRPPLTEADVVDLLLWAGGSLDCHRIAELDVTGPVPHAPLAPLHLVVAAPDEDGSRACTLHVGPASAPGTPADSPWTPIAHGTLAGPPPPRPNPASPGPACPVTNAADSAAGTAPSSGAGAGADPVSGAGAVPGAASFSVAAPVSDPAAAGVWPPAGAEPVGSDAVWRRGQDQVFAELVLDEADAADADRYALHPELLAGVLDLIAELAGRPVRLTGVTRHATGATEVRVHLTRSARDTVTVLLTDADGAPVLTVDRVRVGEGGPAERPGPRTAPDALYRLTWTPVDGLAPAPDQNWAVVGAAADRLAKVLTAEGTEASAHPDPASLGEAAGRGDVPGLVVLPVDSELGTPAESARRTVHRALALVGELLADHRLAGARFVVVTRNAVSTGDDGTAVDPAQAAVRGLLLSAQAEHPDRFVLADLGEREEHAGRFAAAVGTALAAGEPHLALRDGRLLLPRLARVTDTPQPPAPGTPAPGTPGHGTVLVTGATGGIGTEIVRHLAAGHGVRRLLLLSRKGPDDPRAAALARQLAEYGAEATFRACDISDRAALKAVLDAVPAEHPVTAVVHAAGVVDDGVLTTQSPERVDTVMRPKAEAAHHLHELTARLDLSHFVLFSSGVGVFGGAGQANYAAANAFLDALAHRRRAAGLPATSLAWGLWETESGMSARLSDVDRRRMAQAGVLPLTPEQGLALFDRAWASGAATLVPMGLDPAVLRRKAADGTLPAPFRSLVPAPLRRAAAGPGPAAGPSFAQRLADCPPTGRKKLLLELIQRQVAGVLDYTADTPLDARRSFRELGFDSLTAVELRNGLVAATGVQLSAALVFDYPTAHALADHLESKVLGAVDGAPPPVLTQLDRLEAALAAPPPETADREQIAARLRALAAAWSTPPDDADGGDVTSKLDSATDEELFDFINAELGED